MRPHTRRLPREPLPPETATCSVCHIEFETVALFDAHREDDACLSVAPPLISPPVIRQIQPKQFAPSAIDLTHLTK